MDKKMLEKGLELELQFDKRPGIHPGMAPVVLQDARIPTVIALGYESAESFERSRSTNRACILDAQGNPFFERDESPIVTGMRVDCDQDAFVYIVKSRDLSHENNTLFKKKTPELKEGLVPAIAQEYYSGDVLMVGYVNPQAIETAIEKEKATFWSTSRDELWTKGETSGDVLRLREIHMQSNDAVLYLVEMAGDGACHTEGQDGKARRSCFYRQINALGKLEFLPGME